MRTPSLHSTAHSSAGASAEERVAAFDWSAISGELNDFGCAVLPKLLSPDECRTLSSLYPDETRFRGVVLHDPALP
jgi:uncharacterized protein